MRRLICSWLMGLAILGHAVENVPVKLIQGRGFHSPVTHLMVDPVSKQRCVVSLASGQVQYYNGSIWQELHYPGDTSIIKTMSVDWSQPMPRVVVGLEKGAVMYFGGRHFVQLYDFGRDNTVHQMSVDWSAALPKIVVGLECGALMYYDGAAFQSLQNCVMTSRITKLSADWSQGSPRVILVSACGGVKFFDGRRVQLLQPCNDEEGPAKLSVDWSGQNPRIVLAMHSGSVNYYDGFRFMQLSRSVSRERPRQMEVDWSGAQPRIVLGMKSGEIDYYNGYTWRVLKDDSWQRPISQLSVEWPVGPRPLPRIVAGLGAVCVGCREGDALPGGGVEYFDGHYWRELHNNSWRSPISFMSVNWDRARDPFIAIGQGLFYWRTCHMAEQAQSRVAVFAHGSWDILASYTDPVCAMDVNWIGDSPMPTVLYCLGKSRADQINHHPQNRRAYNILITEN